MKQLKNHYFWEDAEPRLFASRYLPSSQRLAIRSYSRKKRRERIAKNKRQIGTIYRNNSTLNNPSYERGKKRLSRVSQPRRLGDEREKRCEARQEKKRGARGDKTGRRRDPLSCGARL